MFNFFKKKNTRLSKEASDLFKVYSDLLKMRLEMKEKKKEEIRSSNEPQKEIITNNSSDEYECTLRDEGEFQAWKARYDPTIS